jgi:hypothetical protein
MLKIRVLTFTALFVIHLTSCNRQAAEPQYTPGLGEILTLTQMRHAKLWFAGQNANLAFGEL